MNQLSRTLIVVIFLITSVGVTTGLASPGDDDPPAKPIYIPFISKTSTDSIYISGTVMDTDLHPITNVTIRDNYGSSAVTDENGEYILNTQKGENLLTAQNPGFTFEPEERSLDTSGDLSGQDFSGITACGDIMVNGLVTAGEGGWDFPVKDQWDYATAGTDSSTFRSAPTSGRTGILPTWSNPSGPDNINVHSNAISQKYYIPSDANHVLLSVNLYPRSTDLSDSDRQYVKILDAYDNTLQVLWNGHKNDATAWNTYFEWELNAYAGKTIKVEIGTFNDGVDGVSWMYFDDVQLLICKQETPSESCNKVINSDFEDGSTGWTIPAQDHPPVISDVRAKSGTQSMKTGNTTEESFSEFYQDVQIPAGADSATLKFHVYTRSLANPSAPEFSAPQSLPQASDSWNRPSAPTTDTNYAYVLDANSKNILRKLLWWSDSNTESWTYLEFDLSAFKGQNVRLLFGTYNDGKGNESTMWVDTVYLDACSGGVVPPSGCYEALSNRGFENNSSWIIPATEYSAGYSTSQVHNGSRSMRAGIYQKSHNVYSYSDFRQMVTIPSSASSADLTTWIWAKSTEPDAVPRAAILDPDLLVPQNVNGRLQMSPEAGDAQYILVLDKYGYLIDTLWWENNPALGNETWDSNALDLMDYKGKTIYLQFGVYNNGWDGVTSMFVDDTSVEICIPDL